jgi:hypothetical protein
MVMPMTMCTSNTRIFCGSEFGIRASRKNPKQRRNDQESKQPMQGDEQRMIARHLFHARLILQRDQSLVHPAQ